MLKVPSFFLPLRQLLEDIPAEVKRFFVRALVVIVLWKIVYLLMLMPTGQPNRWLTNQTARSTAFFLNYTRISPRVYPYYEANKAHVYNVRQQSLLIGNSCNGLELYVLYTGFLICLPVYNLRRLLSFFIAGLCIIFIFNILRCAGLYWMMASGSPWQEVAHKYLFKIVLYSLVTSLWYAYTRTD